MKIQVKVIPRSSQKKIIQGGDTFKVYVHESATDGKANKAVCEVLAKHFSVAKSNAKIIKGEKSKNKIIEIKGE